MKLLFDQNLSFKLCTLLSDLFPDSKPVRDLGLDRSDDRVVWQYSRRQDLHQLRRGRVRELRHRGLCQGPSHQGNDAQIDTDTDGDGTISHDEYIAYQIKIFDMMDTSTAHKGMVGPQEMFATGGANPR